MYDISTRGMPRVASERKLRIAIVASRPESGEQPLQFFVGRSVAQRHPEVEALAGEQAGVETTVGRESGARAIAAEWLRDRRNHADLTAAIGVPPASCHFSPVAGLDRLEWHLDLNSPQESPRPVTT